MLFAGVLAMGVAACGDDVTVTEAPPPPPPPLTVSMTPSNASVTVGESAVFAVGVSGGAEGAQATWTCSSSNTSVASVAVTAAGCRATSVAAGTASITATVTKGNQSANAGAQLTVVAPPTPPTTPLQVSISPSNQTIGIGEAAIFAVGITGGSGTLSHTCTSSAPGVASVAKTDAGCEATGVAAGNATILIAVTKGSETVNVAGQVTVTATPEPAPLAITMTPASQSILVGETAVFAVGITGGATGATVEHTCASSAPATASVEAVAAGCEVTGLAAGNASITVTVTKGEQTATAASQISVTAPAEKIPATVSISSITQTGLNAPVQVNNVAGQIDVTLNVNPNDERVTLVEVLVDGTVAAAQQISGGAGASAASEALQLITLSFNTDAYDAETGTPSYLNGGRQIRARLFAEGAEGDPAASNVVTLQFNNADGFHVVAETAGATALDAQGRRWHGGPDFGVTIRPIPVLFSGRTLETVTVALGACDGGGKTQAASEGTFAFTCQADADEGYVAVEGTGFAPTVTSMGADGNDGPAAILNTDHPFPLRIDTRAPTQTAAGAMVIARDTILQNAGNWINGAYAFATGYRDGNVNDGGVGYAASGVQFAISAGTDTLGVSPTFVETGADIAAQTPTNTALIAWAVVTDRLGNTALFRQVANEADGHPARTFGYDNTAPVLSFAAGTGPNAAAQRLAAGANFTQTLTQAMELQASDSISGFTATGAARHGIVAVRGAFDGEGAIQVRPVVFGGEADDAILSSTPFADVATKAIVAKTAVGYTRPGGTILSVQPFSLAAAVGSAFNGTVPAQYYIYQVEVRDQAGNITRGHRMVYVNNGSTPTTTSLNRPAAWGADAAFFLTSARDSVELAQASLSISYGNIAGSLVWERPGATATSVLRMNAGITDGTMFNDVIYRPQYDVQLPLGLSAHNLPFIKSIQTLDGGITSFTGPTAAAARVYNGFAQNGGTAAARGARDHTAGGLGASTLTEVAIDAESVPAPTIDFSARGITSFGFAAGSATNPCGTSTAATTLCVRLTGAAATFTNPFVGGRMAIVYAHIPSTQGLFAQPIQWRIASFATPQFTGEFSTRDSGGQRIFDWNITTALPAAGAGDRLIYAAIAIAPSGDALVSGIVDPTGVTVPVFNPTLTPASGDIQARTPASPAVEGEGIRSFTLSTPAGTRQGAFTTTCTWVDAGGIQLFTPPAGLGLAVNATSTGCVVTVTNAAAVEIGATYRIKMDASQSGQTATRTAMLTVVRDPRGTLTLTAPTPSAVELPLATSTALNFLASSSETGVTVQSLACSIVGTPAGISVTRSENASGLGCQVTIATTAAAGTYTVSAEGRDSLDRLATATSTFTIHPATTFTGLNPAVATIAYPAVASTTASVSLTTTGPRAITNTTCSVAGASFLTAATTTAAGACVVTAGNSVTDRQAFIDAVVAGDLDYTLTVTYVPGALSGIGAGAMVTATSTIRLSTDLSAAPFAPAVTPSTTLENPNVINRPGNAQFNLIQGPSAQLGLGLSPDNTAAATITVLPANQGVTADLRTDGTERFVRVAVAPDANVNLYAIQVVWNELGTNRVSTTTIHVEVRSAGGIGADPVLSTAVASSSTAAVSERTSTGAVPAGTGAQITVTAKDRFDVPMPNLAVVIGSTSTSAVITPAFTGITTTDQNGVVVFNVTDTAAGTYTYNVTIGGVALATAGRPTITFLPGEAAEIDLAVDVDEESVDNLATLTATVTDEFGNAVEDGTEVIFDIDGAIGVGSDLLAAVPSAGIFPVTKETVDGIAEFTFNEENAGTYSYVATSGSAESDPVDVTWTAGVAGTVTLAASDDEPTAGTDLVLTAEVLDQYGNPVAGETVTFSGEGVEDTTATTNEDGIATTTASYTVAGEQEYTASIGNGDEASVTVEWQPDEAYSMELALDPDTAEQTVGEDVTITVTVFDEYGNTVDDVEVYLIVGTSTMDTETIVATETTDADGKATFTVMNTVAGELDYLFDGNTDLMVRASTTITWIPGAPSAAGTTVAFEDGDDELLSATTTDEITIEITAPTSNGKFFIQVRDQYGNAVEGIRQISWTDSRAGFTGTSVETNAAGLAQINIPGTIGVDDVFTFYLGSVAGGNIIATVTFEQDKTPFSGFLGYGPIGVPGDFLTYIDGLFGDTLATSTTPLLGALFIQSASGDDLTQSDLELYEWKLVMATSTDDGFESVGDLDLEVDDGGAGPVFGLFEGVPAIFWILPEREDGEPTYMGLIAVAFKKVGSTDDWSYLIDPEGDGEIWATTSFMFGSPE
jgi:uncharacterized protein YjdB/protocatechuate 3,4-dioxygenase beta subunit